MTPFYLRAAKRDDLFLATEVVAKSNTQACCGGEEKSFFHDHHYIQS